MRESTIQYLLDELPKLHGLFCKPEDSKTLSFSEMVGLAVFIDKTDELIGKLDALHRGAWHV